ncbi:SIR2 family protein [Companilactobacillus furfuricola]|uniref:SIR2 family protein n=1 Tax=Companilactobacillus furfuricola TaxID=1462575 RepID=UPI000F7A6744|nr:SIR2 family protein [Companilactobacillus furfuricola]
MGSTTRTNLEKGGIEEKYLSKFNDLKNQGKNDFEIYTNIATFLEQEYDRAFYAERIQLNNLTPKEAHKKGKSPFREQIAEIFDGLKFRDDRKEEIKKFTSMLKKARMIVTTNYDQFIEKSLNNAISIKNGNQGLFEPANDLNELYKIHGSISSPNSIVITESDYEELKHTSDIVNAKILSHLTESPIVFIGYSLTDKNIQELLKDLSDNMPSSIDDAAQRIGVVDYVPGENKLVQSTRSTENNAYYTEIKTDNFSKIYSSISAIEQGFTPSELAKYSSALKKIIDVKGQQGHLNKVLTSFVDLKNLPHELNNKNLVVALGDERWIYKYPDYVDYIRAYFSEESERLPEDIAIKFITNTSSTSMLPISKYLTNVNFTNNNISDKDRKRINQRLSNFKDLSTIIEKISIPKKDEPKLDELVRSGMSPTQIFEEKKTGIQFKKKIAFFVKNIENDGINENEILDYLLYSNKIKDKNLSDTTCRKFFMAYSVLHDKLIDKI